MSKSIEELYQEVLASEELKDAFGKAAQEGAIEAFLREQGCEASAEELEAFLSGRASAEGEVSDAELSAVSGGCNATEAALSAWTIGLGCAGTAIASAVNGNKTGANGALTCDCFE